MARVTTEDALHNISNRFLLVKMATQRARQLRAGATPAVDCKNRELVTALREVAEGLVVVDGDIEAMEKESLIGPR